MTIAPLQIVRDHLVMCQLRLEIARKNSFNRKWLDALEADVGAALDLAWFEQEGFRSQVDMRVAGALLRAA